MHLWDLRALKPSQSKEGAHAMLVRDVDFSTKRAHHIVTGGDDCKLRFWDLRSLAVRLISAAL